MIVFDHVGVSVEVWASDGQRATKDLLHDVDLVLEEPRVVVLGANGSGKSTLLRTINGLAEVTSGHVVVNDVDVSTDARTVRSLVGFVFSDALSQLVAPTPVDDLQLSLRRQYRDKRARREAALDALRARGLERLAEQSVYDLSGGERQQVALAGVLAVEPEVVVADEPTTLLDLRARLRVQAELLGLKQQLVFATHDLDFAEQADRAVVIDRGRVAFDGAPVAAIDAYRRMMA